MLCSCPNSELPSNPHLPHILSILLDGCDHGGHSLEFGRVVEIFLCYYFCLSAWVGCELHSVEMGWLQAFLMCTNAPYLPSRKFYPERRVVLISGFVVIFVVTLLILEDLVTYETNLGKFFINI